MRIIRPKKVKKNIVSCRIEQDLYVELLKFANKNNKKMGELFRESLVFFVNNIHKTYTSNQ